MNPEGVIHCETGPAIAYPDGFEIYAWRGQIIPKNWITEPESLTAEIAITHPQIEQRRAACEILGWVKILDELNASEIDRDPDPEIGTLFEVSIPEIGREKFIRVQCGTKREFALPVPPEMKTALEAQAWMVGIDPSEFITPEVRT